MVCLCKGICCVLWDLGSESVLFVQTADLTCLIQTLMPQVSYGELDWMTEQLAIKLRHLGVKNNVVVGILMDHCLEYVISYIAILRAGLHVM